MRIGLDLQVLEQRPWTGVQKYAFELTRALLKLETKHQFVFFVPEEPINGHATKEGKGSEPIYRHKRAELVHLPRKHLPFITSHVTYARIMQKSGLDVLHGPANVLPLTWPLPPHPAAEPAHPLPQGERGIRRMTRSVITLHDLAIYKHPEWFPRHQWFSTKVLVPRSIKKADAIIVPSEATKGDLQELFKVPEEKIHVIPHAPSPFPLPLERGRGGEGVDGSHYILFVGTVEPRKNVARLIEAYQELPAEIRREYDLVIVGKPINGRTTGSLPIHRQGVKFLGYVPDQDLGALYQNASLFVYPSLYEGFGLPVLEAMAAGVPVVTSKDSAMAELVKHNANLRTGYANDANAPSPHPLPLERGRGREGVDGSHYALFVDPYSVHEIRDAMVRLIRPVRPGSGSPRAGPRWRDRAYASQISRAGRALARQFTWEKTARRTLEVYLA